MGLNITIIDYGLGNLGSLSASLNKVGVTFQITSDQDTIVKSHAVIIPGVGSFDRGINELKERNLFQLLRDLAVQGKPILGICLGMQLLFESSEESVFGMGGLGLLRGKVKMFPKDRISIIPHVGWNFVRFNYPLNQFSSDYYFVHSYYCEPVDENCSIGVTEYDGFHFVSSVQRENVFGFQFHPEKSGQIGRELIKYFVAYVKEKNYSLFNSE